MNKFIPILFFSTLVGCSAPQPETYSYPITAVNLNSIKLTDQFWLPKIKTIQDTTISYAIDKCEKEGRMENFLIAGGKKEGKVRGKMPFDDTDLYKIIEGASYSLIMSPDPKLEATIDSLISIIAIGQEKDGYLTTYKTIDSTYSPASWNPAGGRWQHLATSHELYNSGHLFEAASAHFFATGKRNFLDIALKNADLLVETFGAGKNENVPGHQIVETGLIKLYQITGNKSYLELSKHFLDNRGNSKVREIGMPYNQDHKLVVEQKDPVGHAVRAVYMYAGMTDIATLYNDSSYLKAVNTLWENMVNKKMYLTGGIGSRHDGEAFGDDYELPNLTGYNETCAAIGSVLWSQRLFQLTGNSKYFDLIETTLYNGVISGMSLSGSEFFYPNPLESDGKYAFNMGACTRSAWFDCSCCPTNLIRFIPYVPNLFYAVAGDSLYVNLYASNEASIKLKSSDVQIVQSTTYPLSGKIDISVDPNKSSLFTVKVRIPGWAKGVVAPGNLYNFISKSEKSFSVLVNGESVTAMDNGGYLSITRKWAKGDKISIDLPMEVKKVACNPVVTENADHLALEYGPLVYCAEEIDNAENLNWIVGENTSTEVSYRTDLLGGINVIKTDNNLMLIPYYSWANRGVGKMKVWFGEK